MVEEGRARLERAGHRRPVHLHQQVVGEVEADVRVQGGVRPVVGVAPPERLDEELLRIAALDALLEGGRVQILPLVRREMPDPPRIAALGSLGHRLRHRRELPPRRPLSRGRRQASDQGRRASPQTRRHPVAPVGAPIDHVPIVSSEVLVAPVPVEHDGHVAPRQLGDRIARNRGRVAERFVIVPDQTGQDVQDRRSDDELRVVGAVTIGDHPRERTLVEAGLVEAHGKRSDRAIERARHVGDNGARVDAAAQEGSERDIAHEP